MSLLMFFSFLIIVVPLVLCAAAGAAEVIYTGDGNDLQASPNWLPNGSKPAVLPTADAVFFFSDNNVTVNYDAAAAGMTNPYYVIGGQNDSGDATGNTITFIDGKAEGEVYGGVSRYGNAERNKVIVLGGEVVGDVNGGYSQKGNASYNTVAISGGAIGFDVFGGLSNIGSADYNTVTISGGTVKESIYGGASDARTPNSNTVTFNSVTMDGGKVIGDVCAGLNMYGNAEQNKVTVLGGEVVGNVYGGYVNGKGGSTVGNTVAISGGSVGGDIYGGWSNYGISAYNTVDISGGTVDQTVHGGFSYELNAEYNVVAIRGGNIVNEVIGGESQNGDAINNTVYISGGKVDQTVYGGYSWNDVSRVAAYNTVIVSSGEVGGNVIGGWNLYGNTTNNTVSINGGTVGQNVYGGFSREGTAEHNMVTISGGEVDGNVYGGWQYSGNAINNAVSINGGYVTGDFFGGYVAGNGDAINNIVTIAGSPVFSTSSYIHGGHVAGAGDGFTGNTLNFKSSGITAGGVGNFEFYNFYLPDGTAANDKMLSVADSVDLDKAIVEIYLQGSNPLQTGDTISLINSASGVSNYTATTSQASLGAFITYDFDIYANTNDLWAELTSVNISPSNKALTNSRTVPLAFINQGADLIASLEYPEALGDSRYTTFAVVGGGSSTYSTGSDVDIDGFSLLAGVTWNAPVKKNSLALSAFIEAGWGSYDTKNDFGGTTVRGDGDTDYFGGGLHLRYTWDSDKPGGLYAEGALRFGRASTDFNSSDLISGTGFNYDSDSNYYGLHAGLGYVWQLNGKTRLDVSGKYLWTHLDSDETTASNGDQISFDSANSHRLRAGFRFYHDYGNANAVTLYYGAAYEYEFDGDADGRLYGTYALDGSSLSGGSGIGELGVMFRPSKDNDRLMMQLGIQGYVGVREGISGTLKLQYAF